MKLNLTNQQMAKIRKGQNVQIKPHQVGSGMDFDIHPSLQRKINSSVKSGRGFRAYGGDIMMGDSMMEGGKISANRILKKIGIKKDVNQGIKKAAPVLRAVNQGLKSAGLDSIQEVAITQAVDLLPIPSIAKQILAKQATNQVDKLIAGAGIRKTFNRGLKKAGIKKDFYATVNKKNINRAVNYANDVLDEAGYDDDLQNMAIKRITKNDNVQRALRQVADDALYEGSGIRKTFNRGLKKAGIKKDFYSTVNKKNLNRAVNYANDVLDEAGFEDDLQNMAIKRITKNDNVQRALRQVADDVLYEGGNVNPYLPTKYLKRGGSITPNNPLVYDDKSPMLRPRQAGFKAVPLEYIDSSHKPTRYRNAGYGKKPYYGKGFKN